MCYNIVGLQCRSVRWLLVLSYCWLIVHLHGSLLNTLEDMVVMVNDSVMFNCSTDISSEIHWFHKGDYMHAGGKFYKHYGDRFKMETNITDQGRRTYTLVIQSARSEDSGVYTCREDEGRGEMSSANLIVLGSKLVCSSNMHPEGFVGKNTCDLQQENLIFSCSVSFNGIAPRLIWTWLNKNQSFNNTACVNHSNQINCSLTLISDPEFDGSVFTCQTAAPRGKQYNCSTSVIEVHHFSLEHDFKPTEKKIGDRISCPVRSSEVPRFSWTLSLDNQETLLSNNQLIVIQTAGMYWCNASYRIRAVACFSLISVASVQKVDECYTKCIPLTVMLILFVLLSITVTVVFACILRYRKQRQAHKMKTPEGSTLLLNAESKRTDGRELELQRMLFQPHRETIVYKEELTLIHSTIVTKATEQFRPVYGIAILEDELFAISKRDSQMDVYSLTDSNFQYKRSYSVNCVVNPRNIISSSAKNCLYIEDSKDKVNKTEFAKIYKVNPHGEVEKGWEIKEDIGHISIGQNSNIFVAIWDGSKLLEYNSEGVLVHTIYISSDANVKDLRQAMQFRSDYFLLAHGDDDSNEEHKVCVIGSHGHLIKAFGSTAGNATNKVDLPGHFAIDEDGSIIVADRKNQRILLLSSQLEFRRELLKEVGLRNPWRVCLDMKRGYLIVADNTYSGSLYTPEGRILIYSVIHVDK